MSISSDDDTNSTKVLDSKHDSQHDSDVNLLMGDEVDTPYSVELDCDVHMDSAGNVKEEEDEEEEDEEEEYEDEEEEDEDEDEDDGKEPRMFGQREMVNTRANDVDTMADNQPIVLPEQGQESPENTPQPQPLVPALRPQTQEPRPWPRTPHSHPHSGLESLLLVTPQKLFLAVTTLPEAGEARNSSDVHVNQQLVG